MAPGPSRALGGPTAYEVGEDSTIPTTAPPGSSKVAGLERLLGAGFHAGSEQGREHSLVRQAELGEGTKGPWRSFVRS